MHRFLKLKSIYKNSSTGVLTLKPQIKRVTSIYEIHFAAKHWKELYAIATILDFIERRNKKSLFNLLDKKYFPYQRVLTLSKWPPAWMWHAYFFNKL